MAKQKVNHYNWTAFTFSETGGTQVDESLSFQQDVFIEGVFVEKAIGGTFDLFIEPDMPGDGPSIVLGNLSMLAAETSKHFQDRTPLASIGRLRFLSAGVTGDIKVTVYARASTVQGRG